MPHGVSLTLAAWQDGTSVVRYLLRTYARRDGGRSAAKPLSPKA